MKEQLRKCTKCQKNVSTSGPVLDAAHFICDICQTELVEKRKKLVLEEWAKGTVEERLARIEEFLYEQQEGKYARPSPDLNNMFMSLLKGIND